MCTGAETKDSQKKQLFLIREIKHRKISCCPISQIPPFSPRNVHQLSHSPQVAPLPFQADKGLWGPGVLYRVPLPNSNLHILCFSRAETQQVQDDILMVSQNNVSLWKGENPCLISLHGDTPILHDSRQNIFL